MKISDIDNMQIVDRAELRKLVAQEILIQIAADMFGMFLSGIATGAVLVFLLLS